MESPEDITNLICLQWHRVVYYLLHVYGSKHSEDIEDSVTEAILYFLENKSKIDITKWKDVGDWLCDMAKKRLLNKIEYLKNKNFVRNGEYDSGDDGKLDRNLREDMELRIIAKLTVDKLLILLPIGYRNIVWLRDIEELSFEEIAFELSINVENAKKLHQRAYKKLKQIAHEDNK